MLKYQIRPQMSNLEMFGQTHPVRDFYIDSKFFGLIYFSHFFTKEDFDNQCEFFIS